MEPITIIIAALLVGISSEAKNIGKSVVRDSYNGLKKIIKDKYEISISNLQKNPDSKAQQAAIQESLEAAGANSDVELLEIAKQLLEATNKTEQDLSTGIELYDSLIKGKVSLADIQVRGPGIGFSARNTTFENDFEVGPINIDQNTDPK